jgi:hypothetical protein
MPGARAVLLAKISLEARAAYFRALNEFWPGLLEALLRDVMPLYEPRRLPGDAWAIIIETREIIQRDAECKALLDATEAWAHRFRITETWILDAALDTIMAYSPKVRAPDDPWHEKPHWRYTIRVPHPPFSPKLDNAAWYPKQYRRYPWSEDWDVFKERMESQFASQLAEYRRMVETTFAIGRDLMDRDAEWTARWQKGEAVNSITDTAGLTGYSDPEQAVFRAIKAFSTLIGLNRRLRGQRIKPTVR